MSAAAPILAPTALWAVVSVLDVGRRVVTVEGGT